MKKLIILLLVSSILACNKDKDETNGNQKIAGSWEIRKSEGGIAGTVIYPPGNGEIYAFTVNGHYTYTNAGRVADLGTYTIERISSGEWNLHLSGNAETDIRIQLSNNQLVFLPSTCCADMPTLTFARI